MLALATACTALAIATVNSPIVFSIAARAAVYSLLGAVSFFKEGEGGLCKSMNEVAASQKSMMQV